VSQRASAVVGAVLVASIIILQHWFMGPPVILLSIGLVVSYALWLAFYERIPRIRRRIILYFGLAIVVQSLHFLEEYRGGLHLEAERLIGYSVSDRSFVIFNLAALIVLSIAWLALLGRGRLAFLFVWFMAVVGGIGNGVLHLLMSAARGGYFPGAATAVLHLVVGCLTLRELLVTDRPAAESGSGLR
jgi:hypothetical protein